MTTTVDGPADRDSLRRAFLGLGALFFGVFRSADRLLDSLGVPPGLDLIGAIALGHPLPDGEGLSASRPRRDLEEVIHRGGWAPAAPAGQDEPAVATEPSVALEGDPIDGDQPDPA